MEEMTRPSVDLGYPTPAYGKVPSFNSVEEEATFWDTHDVTELIEDTHPVAVSTGPEFGNRSDTMAPDGSSGRNTRPDSVQSNLDPA